MDLLLPRNLVNTYSGDLTIGKLKQTYQTSPDQLTSYLPRGPVVRRGPAKKKKADPFGFCRTRWHGLWWQYHVWPACIYSNVILLMVGMLRRYIKGKQTLYNTYFNKLQWDPPRCSLQPALGWREARFWSLRAPPTASEPATPGSGRCSCRDAFKQSQCGIETSC